MERLDLLLFHFEGKATWPPFYEAAKRIALIQPSSAAVESLLLPFSAHILTPQQQTMSVEMKALTCVGGQSECRRLKN